jgi:hypothetical protein
LHDHIHSPGEITRQYSGHHTALGRRVSVFHSLSLDRTANPASTSDVRECSAFLRVNR